ncbi:MAG: translation initiation factor IF-2 subunit gamma [archaeon]|jgi:translation initiation factor 2 subunit 3
MLVGTKKKSTEEHPAGAVDKTLHKTTKEIPADAVKKVRATKKKTEKSVVAEKSVDTIQHSPVEKVHVHAEHKPSAEHKSPEEHKVHEHSVSASHKVIDEKKECSPETHSKKTKEVLQPEINIGMIGHVDHGKTSLTKALTGKWCDTHSEEMKRGISIRLGYADVTFFKLKTSSGIVYNNKAEYAGKPAEVISKRNVSFVDAPGHETLMTTMLSGAALMNGAVLVIASNEPCPQPRTIEHLMALKFAGVDKVVVAQNKVDLITKEQALENYKAIRNFMDSYGYKDSPIVPTVANFGVNIDSLIEAIETYIPTPAHELEKPLKMFVARSFDINKPGTKTKDLRGAVIGGSITQGIVNVGDEIELAPGLEGRTKTKVLSIAIDGGMLTSARPGGLLAIGTDLDPSMAQNDRLRGQIAAKVGTLPQPVKELNLKLTLFERMIEQNQKEKVIIKVTDPIVITIGTNTVVGFVLKTDQKSCLLNLKTEVIAEKNEKVALSKNINGQWRLIAYGEVM